MIVEAITGNTFAEELRTRILEPYGLNQTFFPPTEETVGPMTTGWTSFTSATGPFTTDATVMLNDCYASMVFTAGALVSYPKDVAKFTRLLFSGEILSNLSLSQMRNCTNVNFSDGCTGYGYGTMRYVFNGRTFFGHSGDISGFTQMTIHQAQDSVTLTLSINRNNAPRNPIAQALLDVLDQTLEIQEKSPEASFFVSPNPASSEIKIEAEKGQVKHLEIYTQTGKLVQSETWAGNATQSISVEKLPEGVYFLQLSGDQDFSVQKVVVRH